MRKLPKISLKKLIYVIFLFVLKLHTSRGAHLHKARLAHEHELKPLLSEKIDGEHFLLGEARFGFFTKVTPTEDRPHLANMLLLGSTGKGKSRHIIAQGLTWTGPIIANDIKGEIEDAIAGYRATLGGGEDGEKLTYRFDPTGKGDKFDPLEGRHTDADLLSAATNLLFRPDEGENAIFTERAIVMLSQIFRAARLEGQPPLPFTYKIINEGLIGVATILEIISQKYNTYPNLATVFLDITFQKADFDSRFLQDCWSTCSTRMKRLLTKENIRCFSGSDFTAEKIMTSKKPVSVFLRWPEKDLLSLSPLINLVWETLLDGMIGVYDKAKGRNCRRVLVLLDEIFRTGMPKLPEYTTTVRSRNISLLVSAQSKSQFDAAYGKYKAEILRGQFDTQIVYAPAPADNETAHYVEETLDYKSGFAHSKTEHEHGVSTGSVEQRIPVMSAHEIKYLGRQRVIVLTGDDIRPFVTRKIDPNRFPEINRRMHMKAPEAPALPPLDLRPYSGFSRTPVPIPLFLAKQ